MPRLRQAVRSVCDGRSGRGLPGMRRHESEKAAVATGYGRRVVLRVPKDARCRHRRCAAAADAAAPSDDRIAARLALSSVFIVRSCLPHARSAYRRDLSSPRGIRGFTSAHVGAEREREKRAPGVCHRRTICASTCGRSPPSRITRAAPAAARSPSTSSASSSRGD